MFTTGEFSKLAQVSKRLLRHYNELGLLKPTHTDPENGYHYYSAAQLPELNRIIALKTLGMSLDQIARFIHDDVSVDTMRGMLLLKKAELEQQVREELAQINMIESRLKQIEFHADVVRDVVVKQIPEQWILGMRQQVASQDVAMDLFGELMTALPMPNNALYDSFIGIMHDEADDGMLDIELGRLIRQNVTPKTALASGIDLEVRTLPAVETMATFVVEDPGTDAHIGYSAIGTWAEANDYVFCGPVREVVLGMPTEEQMETMLTEIQFPVAKQSK